MKTVSKRAQQQQPIGHFEEALAIEQRQVRHLRTLVDFALALIAQSDLSLTDAHRLVQAVRNQAYQMFPDKKETFELIYTPRFRRVIAEKFAMQ